MKLVLTLTPFLISFLTGYLCIDFLFRKIGSPRQRRERPKPDLLVSLFLAGGLGLGLSAYISFISFVCLGHLNKPLSLAVHAVIILILLFNKYQRPESPADNRPVFHLKTTAPLLLILLAMIPVWIEAGFYPMGGWDAWSVWNFKAKCLLLGGDQWKNFLDPILWRSSPHYPLLLPLVNVWGWTFLDTAPTITPLITSILFAFLTAGLLFSILRQMTKSYFSVAAPLLLLTLPFYNTLATSQYSDIVLGYFALAALYCLMKMMKEKDGSAYALLSGLFLGFLSFTKPEGMVAALLMVCLAFMLFTKPDSVHLNKRKVLGVLLAACLLSFIPTIIFKILYSPGNQTYVNGFFSHESPVTLYRLKMILAFFLMELKSPKWNGIWILCAAGILLSTGKCWRKDIRILPLFLALYTAITLAYYDMNTYFEIKWWLQASMNRILFSLLPVMMFWVFCSIGISEQD